MGQASELDPASAAWEVGSREGVSEISRSGKHLHGEQGDDDR